MPTSEPPHDAIAPGPPSCPVAACTMLVISESTVEIAVRIA